MTPPGICIGKQKFASRGSIKIIVQMPQGFDKLELECKLPFLTHSLPLLHNDFKADHVSSRMPSG
jgi:hypothetical protein